MSLAARDVSVIASGAVGHAVSPGIRADEAARGPGAGTLLAREGATRANPTVAVGRADVGERIRSTDAIERAHASARGRSPGAAGRTAIGGIALRVAFDVIANVTLTVGRDPRIEVRGAPGAAATGVAWFPIGGTGPATATATGPASRQRGARLAADSRNERHHGNRRGSDKDVVHRARRADRELSPAVDRRHVPFRQQFPHQLGSCRWIQTPARSKTAAPRSRRLRAGTDGRP